jgi:hypothetical protein
MTDAGMVVLRLVHIFCGVYWAGTIFFFVTLLEPSMRDSGPDGARVMQSLIGRHYLNIMPAIAGLTIVAGFLLMWRVSSAFNGGWMSSGPGRTLSLGALSAIIAFGIGIFGMRRSVLRIGDLMRQAGQTPDGPAKDALLAQVPGLRRRAQLSARWVAVFLALTVATMAMARYVR